MEVCLSTVQVGGDRPLLPLLKISLYVVFALSLFFIRNIYSHLFIALSVSFFLLLLPFRAIKGGLIPIIVFLLFTFGGNIFFHPGRIIYGNGFLSITDEGIRFASIRTLRVFSMIGGAKILTSLLPPGEMIKAMDRILRPLERIGLPVSEFFSIMGLTLKSFPLLTDYLLRTYREDIKKNELRGFLSRVKHTALFLMPIFVESIRSPEKFFDTR